MEKTVLITGASRGIGKAAAEAFAKKGYTLALVGHSHMEELKENAHRLQDTYRVSVSVLEGDVSDPEDAKRLVSEATAACGQIDILINNAGISIVGLLTDLSDLDWQRILNTNLSSVFYMSKAVIPQMVNRKEGRILNVSSVFGEEGASCEAAYSATKAGIDALTKSLGKELAPSNIQVNAAAFGAIDTSMNDNLNAEEKSALSEEIPAGRFATAKEAGEFLVMLAEAPDYLNGQVMRFDGAWI